VTLVVDASVAAKWVLPEAHSDRAAKLGSGAEPIIAPDLVYAEIGNAIWKRAVQGELSVATAVEALATAVSLFGALVPMQELSDRAIEIAIQLEHPIYDCFYIALAERERATLVSADRRLLAAAKGIKACRVRPL
jgi:predicted nucleic acid-binding protein